MAVATRTHVPTLYRILIRRRSDNDLFTEWIEVGTHASNSRALVALREWLFEQNEPLTGEYRAESTRDGYFAQDFYGGQE